MTNRIRQALAGIGRAATAGEIAQAAGVSLLLAVDCLYELRRARAVRAIPGDVHSDDGHPTRVMFAV